MSTVRKPYIVGITGGIACGKSTVSGMLSALGASIIDADQISHSLTAPNGAALPAIRQTFGSSVFNEDGTLDRPALSALVFSDKAAIEKLNAIIHPLVKQHMEDQLTACRKQGAQIVILDVPLLFEASMQNMGDMVACVVAPEEVQIARMASRNGYTREEALSRIRNQMPVSEKARLSDVVIDTNKPLTELQKEIERLYQGWTARKEQA